MRAAVIGLGNKGFYGYYGYPAREHLYPEELTHVGAIMHTKDLKLVAAADNNEENLQVFKDWVFVNQILTYEDEIRTPRAYLDYEKMLSDVKPDVVTIATPVETHKSICRNVMRFDSVKAILLEKPIAANLEEAGKILRSQREFNIPIVINHTRRWHPAWKFAKRKVRELGGALNIVGFCNGESVDAGIHMFDMFNYLDSKAAFHYIDLHDPTLGKYQPYLVFEVHAFCEKGRVWITGNGDKVEWGTIGVSSRYRDLKVIVKYEAMPNPPKGCKFEKPSSRCYNPIACDKEAQLAAFAELRDLALGKRKRPTCSAKDGYKALEELTIWNILEDE